MMDIHKNFKVMAVFGTRPEAIKMCPLVLELKKSADIQAVVCLTGQHREMLDSVMEVFGVSSDYDLSVMKPKQNLGMITSAVLGGLDGVLEKECPDLVLVHGDTTTSFAAGLAAFYRHIPVGHVEAGLRTYDLQSPFPEEFNRQAVDMISDLYFAPTELAKQQLTGEGKDEGHIFVTGNTGIDALRVTVKEDYSDENLEWASDSRLILMTAHRRENIGMPMNRMFRAIRRIVDENSDIKLIYPVHKNPAVREIARQYLSGQERIRLIEPLDVLDFHNYISRCYLILTDSGGIQEEAPSFGKPVLVMRNMTERPEGVAAGTLKLVGTEEEKIYLETKRLLQDEEAYRKMSRAANPYGDGHASERIVEVITSYAKSQYCSANL